MSWFDSSPQDLGIEVAPGMRRAAIYLRVSTNSQAETDFDAEGLSIKAQRHECLNKAKALNATVVEEYVDIGESARSANRERLQAMLERLAQRADIDYVIVHKIDRLARNRLDDVSITMAIQKAGAKLVSCSENIDETPQGKFMHAIMAGVAELYSANLSTEASKGMHQKAKLGGTPTVAPIGYLNVRTIVESHEVRTVAVDDERAEHIRWAFEQYATGDWALRSLTEALEARGLRTRRTAKRPGNSPLSMSQVQRVLRNPYYVGIVTYKGVQYEGRHHPIVDLPLFETVQQVLTEKSQTGERPSRHRHYLKGTLFCGMCGGQLALSYNRGRQGVLYGYMYCLNRQRTGECTLPWVPIEEAEELVEHYWERVRPSEEKLARTREQIEHHVKVVKAVSQKELKRQHSRLERLDREERKLLEAHYAEAVSLALLREEQARIAAERQQAQQVLAATQLQFDQIADEVEFILDTLGNGHELYRQSAPAQRRTMNRSVFERLWVTRDGIIGANLAPGFAHAAQDSLELRLQREARSIRAGETAVSGSTETTYQREGTTTSEDWTIWELEFADIERPDGPFPAETKNPAAFRRQGSNESLLVEVMGLEPTTSTLRT